MKTRVTLVMLVAVSFFVFVDVSFAPPETFPPVAVLTVDPEYALVDEEIILDGTGSYDGDTRGKDPDITLFQWDVDYDGVDPNWWYEETTGDITHSYSSPGIYTVLLRVTDNDNPAETDDVEHTVYVRPSGIIDVPGDMPTIQEAIDIAADGCTIRVAEGTYYENIDFKGKAITLTSSDPNDWETIEATIIDANSLGDAVTFDSAEDANSVITGFTITGADGTGDYGIYCDSASPTITRCIVTGNSDGIVTDSSSVVVDVCKIHNNTYTGIWFAGGSPTATNSFIYENDMGIGNADGSSATITNNTVVDNTSEGIDSGVGGAYPTITNCILWGNTDDLYGGFTATYSCIEDGDGVGDPNTHNIDEDPNFIDAANDNYHLNLNSPCIDAGDPNFVPDTGEVDIDGEARVSNDIVDIGADEVDANDIIIPYDAIYVDVDATGNDDGSSWANAYNDLQDALTVAVSDDEIWVAEGTYYPDGTDPNNRSLSFELVAGVALYGGFDATETSRSQRDPINNGTILSGDIDKDSTLDDDNSYHVVIGAGTSTTIIDGFTITMGYADGSYTGTNGDGAGMYNYQVTPTINNCKFTYNSANTGSGMCNRSCSPTVTNCLFISNTGLDGGPWAGIESVGAGMANMSSSSSTITNCVFTDNYALEAGGGLYNHASAPTLTNCIFVDNEADWAGGGIANISASPTIINCTITANHAGNEGGGIANWNGGAVTVKNSIIRDNSCDGKHTDGYYKGKNFQNGDDNTTGDSWTTITYSCMNVSLNAVDWTFAWQGGGNTGGTGCIYADPKFVNAGNPDGADGIWFTADDGLRLSSANNSPCIDAANGNVDPTTDILGNERFDDPNTTNTGIGDPVYVDMGAYEYQGS